MKRTMAIFITRVLLFIVGGAALAEGKAGNNARNPQRQAYRQTIFPHKDICQGNTAVINANEKQNADLRKSAAALKKRSKSKP